MPSPDDIIHYWFGELLNGWTAENRYPLWFEGRIEDDAEMAERFGVAIDAALAGELEDWLQSPTGALAYILLLDQMTRATRRNTAEAYAGDVRALAACHRGLDSNQDQALPIVYRTFFYLPLEHSESLADQERCVSLFNTLRELAPEHTPLSHSYDYAVQHRDVIARFGRYPQRNSVLGRHSTAAETAYLEQSPERWGQGVSEELAPNADGDQ